jgi:hypothetical protein
MLNDKLNLVISCPHCNDPILIDQLNCKIFRHAVFKNNGLQINPHASKLECEDYLIKNLIYGCGKPFKINSQYLAEICDYI